MTTIKKTSKNQKKKKHARINENSPQQRTY